MIHGVVDAMMISKTKIDNFWIFSTGIIHFVHTQNFPKTFHPWRAHVSFSENFAYVLNE